LAISHLFAGKYQMMLVKWNALVVLEFSFDICDGVTRLHLKSNDIAHHGFHTVLHLSVYCSDTSLKRLFSLLKMRNFASQKD
jgi:hypothetical protein